jgi:hypothetical protein
VAHSPSQQWSTTSANAIVHNPIVDVWRVPHEMRGSYSEIFAQLEAQQRQLPA